VEIKAADVKKLREKTGAGMMDCKKALTDAEGDFTKAEKILKELGLAAAAKRGGKATNEGRIFAYAEGDKGVLLELSCETDFVARNTDFINLGNELATQILQENLDSVTPALEEKMKDAIAKIKENMSIRRFKTMDAAEDELISSYIHGEGRIGVIVKIKASAASLTAEEEVKNFAFDTALHVAAYNPPFLSEDRVDDAYLKEQEEIFRKQAENLGKPEKVVEGIVKGKLRKHISEVCLVNQIFVKDNKRSLGTVAKDLGKSLDGEITVADYLYFAVGEELS
jgi:elongation factor Ts